VGRKAPGNAGCPAAHASRLTKSTIHYLVTASQPAVRQLTVLREPLHNHAIHP